MENNEKTIKTTEGTVIIVPEARTAEEAQKIINEYEEDGVFD